MRETSKYLVNVLDISKMQEKAIKYLKDKGLFDEGCVLVPRANVGIIAMNGKHWFINTEGVGNEKPLEEEQGIIDWYVNRGNVFGNYPAVTSYFDFEGLMNVATVTETVTLDKFIRATGNAPERNYWIWTGFLSRN